MLRRFIGAGLFGLGLICSSGLNASFELVSRIVGEPRSANGPNRTSESPSTSADGRFVAFVSDASNLSSEIPSSRQDHIYVYDRETDNAELVTPQANSNSMSPAISADGRFVAFSSSADNLVAGDTNGTSDLFVYDRDTQITERLTSVANGLSESASISADGRFVAFTSAASNLAPNDTNSFDDIFVYDRNTDTIELITNGSNFDSLSPSISADGRFVAFISGANSLVSGDSNNQFDVFVYDRLTNSTEQLTAGSNGPSSAPSISANGAFVTFESVASNLVNDDTNDQRDVFVYDRADQATKRLTANADNESSAGSVSADGRFITFTSEASNLGPNEFTGREAIYLYDQSTEGLERIFPNAARDIIENPGISANGQVVIFSSSGGELLPGDVNNRRDVIIYDRLAMSFERIVTPESEFVIPGANADSDSPSVSENGRFVAFESNATNLVVGDTNERSDIFVFDRQTSSNQQLIPGFDLDSKAPSINSDGRVVAFQAQPRGPDIFMNLAETRIFVHDRDTDSTEALTPEGNAPSFNPSISGDGRFVVFESEASNLVPEDSNGETADIFLYDRDTNTTELLTAGGNGQSRTPAISADGRFVTFSSEANNLLPNDNIDDVFDVFVYDRTTGILETLTRGGNNASLNPSISRDGQVVAFASHASNLVDVPGEIPNRTFFDRDIFVHDRTLNTTTAITPRIDNARFSHASVSADGRLVAFSLDNLTLRSGISFNGIRADVFVYDRDTGIVEPVNLDADNLDSPGVSVNGVSISGNGGVIAFSNRDSNLGIADAGSDRDVFISVTAAAVNGAPSADSVTATTVEDTPLALTITGSDPDADTLSFEVLTQPANGELSGTAPNFVYTPEADFFGTDSFTFATNDGELASESATVTVTVTPVNDAPTGLGVLIGNGLGGGSGATTLTAPADTPFRFTLVGADTDSDQLTFSLVGLPANGSVAGELPNLTYTPDSNFRGADSFTFTVTDGDGASESVTIAITVVDATVNLLSAVLPASRSVEVGTTATAFATLINAGSADALGCGLRLPSSVAGDFFYQASDASTNAVIGERNIPVDIPAGASQSFVFGITPSDELSGAEVAIEFQCANATEAASFVGLNTLLLTASFAPVPDLIALAATLTNNGVTELNNNSGFFSASTVNVGAAATITVSADTGDATLPVTLSLCQTDPATSVCINPTVPGIEPVLVDISEGGSPTFAVFVSATDNIVLDPVNSRVFLRFSDELDVIRGSTSVALENTP